MNVECPSCKTILEVPGVGRFHCPNCGQHVEVAGEKNEVTLKRKIDNGLGWWSLLDLIAWLMFFLPGGFCVFAFVFNVATKQAVDAVLSFLIGAVGVILILIGSAIHKWASSGHYSVVCANCGNNTTKTAIMCAACKMKFG
jgi:predicted RNA-binding Zn-ribbon protein involved in translation (DUF1610 family)